MKDSGGTPGFNGPIFWVGLLVILVVCFLFLYLLYKILVFIIKRTNSSIKATSNRPAPAPPVFPIAPQINYVDAFEQAVHLAQAGRKDEAYQRLKALEPDHPKEISLLLWIGFTSPNKDEAERVIAAAEKIAPSNSSVKQARQWFTQTYP
jgi:hypothetical protein